jgi:hypothetical protein
MLENTGALIEALALWKKLDRSKDAGRVEKAIASGKNGKAKAARGRPKASADGRNDQLSLF